MRFTDDRRRGRMWDGFIGEPNLLLKRDMASVDAFKAAICDRFQSNNVHVIFSTGIARPLKARTAR